MGTLTYLTHLTELCWTENNSQAWVLPPNLHLRRQLTLVVLRRAYSLEVAPQVAITRLKAEANNSIKHIQVVLQVAHLKLLQLAMQAPTSNFYKLLFKRNNSRISTHPVTRCWIKLLLEPLSRSPNWLPHGASVPRSPLTSSS